MLSRRDVVAILGRTDVTLDDVAPFVRQSPHGYARMRVARTDAFELLVMTWMPGQGSIPHDHAGSICALRVVSGHVRETLYQPAADGLVDGVSEASLVEGEVIVDRSENIHALMNGKDESGALVTLHVYAPPLPELRRFAARSQGGTPSRAFVEARALDAPVVAVIGGGFSGTLTASHLLRLATEAQRAVHVVILDRQAAFGEGPAYRTPDPHHLLNVPASNMSAWPDRPGDFLAWAQASDPSVKPYDFLPRKRYGEYIRSTLLDSAAAAGPGITVDNLRVEVDSVKRNGAGWQLESGGKAVVSAQAVILATGHRPPDDPLEGRWSGSRTRYVEDPWATLVLSAIRPDETVVLLGSGLTSIDVVLSITKQPRSAPIVALSRRGLLPAAHAPSPVPPRDPSPWLLPLLEHPERLTARALFHGVRASVKEITRSHSVGSAPSEQSTPAGSSADSGRDGNWRSVIDGLRPFTARIWQALANKPSEAKRFLRVVRPYWEIHRHRMAPHIADKINALKEEGALVSCGARVLRAEATTEEVLLTLQRRGGGTETLRADWVVNCTGPGASASVTPVVSSLVAGDVLEFDPLGLGVNTDSLGRATAKGAVHPDLVVVGTLRKAQLWESTAVPELRVQARDAARTLAEQLGWLPRAT